MAPGSFYRCFSSPSLGAGSSFLIRGEEYGCRTLHSTSAFIESTLWTRDDSCDACFVVASFCAGAVSLSTTKFLQILYLIGRRGHFRQTWDFPQYGKGSFLYSVQFFSFSWRSIWRCIFLGRLISFCASLLLAYLQKAVVWVEILNDSVPGKKDHPKGQLFHKDHQGEAIGPLLFLNQLTINVTYIGH